MTPGSDVIGYESALQSIEDGASPYVETDFEYPPGSLPFIVVPEVLRSGHSFLVAFILLMLVVDAAGFIALLLMTGRSGSLLGAWVWVLGLAVLGPLVQLRLDLVPAVATIWAMERTSADDWTGAGAFIGIGAMAKLYPALLIPNALILSRARVRFVIAVVVTIAAFLVPIGPNIDEVARDVLGYHLQRGVQIESLGGSILFLAQLLGYEGSEVVFNFGALHFDGGFSELVKTLSSAFALLGVGACIWLATRVRAARREAYVEISLVAITLSVAFGSVFSPQFMIWIVGLAAAASCLPASPLRAPSAALVGVTILTSILTLPFFYPNLLAGAAEPVLFLLARNLILVAIGIWSFVRVHRRIQADRADHATEPANGPSTRDLASA